MPTVSSKPLTSTWESASPSSSAPCWSMPVPTFTPCSTRPWKIYTGWGSWLHFTMTASTVNSLGNENGYNLCIDQDLQREFNESNGNGSLPIVSTTQTKQSSEIGSTAEEPEEQTANSNTRNSAEPKEDKSTRGCGLSSVTKASRRAASVFTVENPHNIDCHARTLFPMAFLFVNILYWLYYLFLWAFSLKLVLCCFHHPDASLPPHLRPVPVAAARLDHLSELNHTHEGFLCARRNQKQLSTILVRYELSAAT